MSVFCIYHRADMDGKCAGAIIKRHRPEVQLIPMDYKDEFPKELVNVCHATIYIVDFSFPRATMRLLRDNNNVIWLDHHKSAIIEMGEIEFEGIQDTSLSGCELAWKWCNPDTAMPTIVELIGSYDTWRWIKEDKSKQHIILNLMAGCQLTDFAPEDPVWGYFFHPFSTEWTDIVSRGMIIRQYEARQDKILCESSAWVNEWEGGRWLICNTQKASKTVFDEYMQDKDVVGVVTWYQMADRRIKFSLRSDHPDIDCSAIAKKYGGGGHKGAAGYVTDWIDCL